VEWGKEWRQSASGAKKHQHFPLGPCDHLAVWTVNKQE